MEVLTMKKDSSDLMILFVVEHFNHSKYTRYIGKKYNTKIVYSVLAMEKEINSKNPDLVVLDNNLIKNQSDENLVCVTTLNRMVPVILLINFHNDALVRLRLGFADFFLKPIIPKLLEHRINIHMKNIQELKLSTKMNLAIHDKLKEKSEELVRMQTSIIGVLSEAIEFRDFETETHNLRTQSYVELMLRKMIESVNPYQKEISLWDIDVHIMASQLHDIGKIGIPDDVLLKRDSLTVPEFIKVQEHVEIGIQIIDKILSHTGDNEYLNIAKRYIISHHEHWDGNGYPNGLKGTDIPLEGRILAIVDVYDALTSVRSYKEAMDHESAVKIIIAGSGSHFDPTLIDIFKLVSDQFKEMIK